MTILHESIDGKRGVRIQQDGQTLYLHTMRNGYQWTGTPVDRDLLLRTHAAIESSFPDAFATHVENPWKPIGLFDHNQQPRMRWLIAEDDHVIGDCFWGAGPRHAGEHLNDEPEVKAWRYTAGGRRIPEHMKPTHFMPPPHSPSSHSKAAASNYVSPKIKRLAQVALNESPPAVTDWHEAALSVCRAVAGPVAQESTVERQRSALEGLLAAQKEYDAAFAPGTQETKPKLTAKSCPNCGGEGRTRDYARDGEDAPWEVCWACGGKRELDIGKEWPAGAEFVDENGHFYDKQGAPLNKENQT